MLKSNRIEVKEFKDEAHIEIFPKVQSWQLSAFLVWNIAWTLCGFVIFYELFFGNLERDFKLILFTYLAFWAFFEYKGISYFVWKKWGRERIRIFEDGIQYKKDMAGYGAVKTFDKENISKFVKIEIDSKSFAFSYQQSFWMPGNETIGFQYLGKMIGLGLQLSSEEQQELLKVLRFQYQRIHSN